MKNIALLAFTWTAVWALILVPVCGGALFFVESLNASINSPEDFFVRCEHRGGIPIKRYANHFAEIEPICVKKDALINLK